MEMLAFFKKKRSDAAIKKMSLGLKCWKIQKSFIRESDQNRYHPESIWDEETKTTKILGITQFLGLISNYEN